MDQDARALAEMGSCVSERGITWDGRLVAPTLPPSPDRERLVEALALWEGNPCETDCHHASCVWTKKARAALGVRTS